MLEMVPYLECQHNLSWDKSSKQNTCRVEVLLVSLKLINLTLIQNPLVVSLYVLSGVEHPLMSCQSLLLVDFVKYVLIFVGDVASVLLRHILHFLEVVVVGIVI